MRALACGGYVSYTVREEVCDLLADDAPFLPAMCVPLCLVVHLFPETVLLVPPMCVLYGTPPPTQAVLAFGGDWWCPYLPHTHQEEVCPKSIGLVPPPDLCVPLGLIVPLL